MPLHVVNGKKARFVHRGWQGAGTCCLDHIAPARPRARRQRSGHSEHSLRDYTGGGCELDSLDSEASTTVEVVAAAVLVEAILSCRDGGGFSPGGVAAPPAPAGGAARSRLSSDGPVMATLLGPTTRSWFFGSAAVEDAKRC
jgi:hypothetical protein